MYKVIWIEALGKKIQAVLFFYVSSFVCFQMTAKATSFHLFLCKWTAHQHWWTFHLFKCRRNKIPTEALNNEYITHIWIFQVIQSSSIAHIQYEMSKYNTTVFPKTQKTRNINTRADPVTHKQTDKNQRYHNELIIICIFYWERIRSGLIVVLT